VDVGIRINGLKLNLFDASRCVESPFLNDFLCAGSNARMGGIDVVIEDLISPMIAIGNAIVRSSERVKYPLKKV
jgi:hypothetical protein